MHHDPHPDASSSRYMIPIHDDANPVHPLQHMLYYINAAHVLQHDQLIMLQYMRCIDVVHHVPKGVHSLHAS
jgi:hypothetical protein